MAGDDGWTGPCDVSKKRQEVVVVEVCTDIRVDRRMDAAERQTWTARRDRFFRQ